MESSSFTGLINNVALLLAMGIVYDSLGLQNIRQRSLREVLTGLLVGLLGIAVMLTPWELIPGVFFDARWILISLCGLYFGVTPTLIAVIMTVSLRLYQGGAGIYVGSAVIICSALLGLGCRAYIEKCNKPLTWWRIYLLGLTVQVTVLCLMFFMPEHLRYKIISAIAPTILIFYPIGTMLLGMIISRQEQRRKAEQELVISRQSLNRERGLLRGLIDALPDHIFIKDRKGRYLGCNKAYQAFTGLKEAELIGQTDGELAIGNHAHIAASDIEQVIRELTPINREGWAHTKQGSLALLESQIAPFLDMDGSPQGIVGISRDITEKRKAEERIITLSQAIEQSPVSVVITSPSGEIEYVNSSFEVISGYSQSEVLGKNSRILKSGKTPSGRYSDMWAKLMEGQSWQGEFQNKRKNGDIFWEQAHIAPVFDTEGEIRHFLAVKQDITQQKAQEETILHQAHFDSLTQLPNRFLAMHTLEKMMRDAKRNKNKVAVLFLDMDDFKKVNDTLGHDTGDKILIEASKRLKSSIRDSDTVGRLGGDEFIVLIDHFDNPEQALPIAQNLLQQFRSPLSIEGREILLTMSIGVAVYPGDGESPSEMLRNADSAMYYSKAAGRNSIHFYTQQMNIEANRRLLLEEQMHSALHQNEFHLDYQPVIDLKTRTIVGAEALLRWNSKELGAISPEEFIPIAEHTGLIVEIGQFVLNAAIRTSSFWIKEICPDFNIAINISPRQFRDPHLVESIESIISKYDLNGSHLELEITEGVLMAQHADIEHAIESLAQKGISISMDDFGTGYSSLSYLRSYPFDILKIDRSFINDISIDTADLELVNASIDMAHGLGLKVIAEGVETEEQVALLISKQCEMAQGYFFSKPVSAEILESMLRNQMR